MFRVLLIVLLLGRGVAAESLQELARQYVTQALSLHDAGRYDEAIELYKKAYDTMQLPKILFNLGQAYRLKGDARNALEHYQRYLDLEPNGRYAPEASRWVGDLNKALEEERVKKEPDARPAEAAPAGGEARPIPSPAREGGGGQALRIAGIATFASGLVLAGVGVKFGLDARHISDEISQQEVQWTDEVLARQAEGKAAERRMFIFVGAGAAAAVAGVTLYVLGRRADRPDRVNVLPSVSAGGAALVVRGRF